VLAGSANSVEAATVTLAWDRNPESTVINYSVFAGTAPGVYTLGIAVGNRTDWTFTGLADNTRYYFAVQAQTASAGSALATITYTTPPAVTPGSEQSRSDFNRDGRLDLLWQNSSTGQLIAWHMIDQNLVGVSYPSPDNAGDLNWKVKGIADLNSDGKPDLLWRNDTTGAMTAWMLNGTKVFSSPGLSTVTITDPAWKIVAIRDFDGDNKPDLVWQNSSNGMLAMWFMDGTTAISYSQLSIPQLADTNWKIVGSGELNGDGKSDLIWQNFSTGELSVWFMDGARVVNPVRMTPIKVADPAWKVQATGDMNGDGWTDLIWKHDTTNQLAVWYMVGTSLWNAYLLYPPTLTDTNWKIVGPK
jgi:hypothetical protein